MIHSIAVTKITTLVPLLRKEGIKGGGNLINNFERLIL